MKADIAASPTNREWLLKTDYQSSDRNTQMCQLSPKQTRERLQQSRWVLLSGVLEKGYQSQGLVFALSFDLDQRGSDFRMLNSNLWVDVSRKASWTICSMVFALTRLVLFDARLFSLPPGGDRNDFAKASNWLL